MNLNELLNEAKDDEFITTDAPEADGRFKELSAEALAKWLMKTRKNDKKRVYGSLTQQIRFNKDDPKYVKKMERTREIVKAMKD